MVIAMGPPGMLEINLYMVGVLFQVESKRGRIPVGISLCHFDMEGTVFPGGNYLAIPVVLRGKVKIIGFTFLGDTLAPEGPPVHQMLRIGNRLVHLFDGNPDRQVVKNSMFHLYGLKY